MVIYVVILIFTDHICKGNFVNMCVMKLSVWM